MGLGLEIYGVDKLCVVQLLAAAAAAVWMLIPVIVARVREVVLVLE